MQADHGGICTCSCCCGWGNVTIACTKMSLTTHTHRDAGAGCVGARMRMSNDACCLPAGDAVGVRMEGVA